MPLEDLPTSTVSSEQASERGRVEFILALGRALQRYGTPAHRLESALAVVSQVLGTEARFYATPTAIFASFGKPEALRTGLIRTEPGDIDLERLGLVDALASEVVHRVKTPEQGAVRLAQIVDAPPRYSSALILSCFALAAGAATRLFGGGWREIGIGSFASLCAGLLDSLGRSHPTLGKVKFPLAALVASGLATYAASRVPIAVPVATLGGIFVLLPGLGLTVAMTELSTQNLISGTAKLTGSAVVLLQLVFGVALGTRLVVLFPPAFAAPLPQSAWTELPALAILIASLVVLLRADPRDAGWISGACALAYFGSRGGEVLLGPELGAFAGAVVLGVASNGLARVRDRPALITIVPGLLLLVPGSVGFRGLQSLLGRDVIAGMDTLFWMIMIAASLGAGLLFANVILSPRRVL